MPYVSPQPIITELQERLSGVLETLTERAREEGLRAAGEQFSKELSTLDALIAVLRKHGASPDLSARLAIRYWVRGVDEKIHRHLHKKWKVSEEELFRTRAEMDAVIEQAVRERA